MKVYLLAFPQYEAIVSYSGCILYIVLDRLTLMPLLSRYKIYSLTETNIVNYKEHFFALKLVD